MKPSTDTDIIRMIFLIGGSSEVQFGTPPVRAAQVPPVSAVG